jgi:hypothetical protein
MMAPGTDNGRDRVTWSTLSCCVTCRRRWCVGQQSGGGATEANADFDQWGVLCWADVFSMVLLVIVAAVPFWPPVHEYVCL